MNTIALLTGKKNNTLRNKHLISILGLPLCLYPATIVKKSKYINDFYCSSDSEEILKLTKEIGYKLIERPDYLATENSQHIDVIEHALEEINQKVDILVVVMANSATIKIEWIDKSIEMIMKNKKISAVVPVIQDQGNHPYRAKRIDKNGYLQTYFDFGDKQISTNRQDLEPNYFLCHNFWVLNLKQIDFINGQQPWIFLGNKIKPLIVSESFDVHNLDDIQKTETWLLLNGIKI